jgi:RNase P/RNase MRP subunit POP5
MRLKLRYYVFRLEYGGGDASSAAAGTSKSDIFASVRASMQEVFGDAGWGAVASTCSVTHFWPAGGGRGVIRAPSSADADVRAAVALVKSVKRRAAALHVEAAAGSVRTLRDVLQRNGLLAGLSDEAAPRIKLAGAVAASSAAASGGAGAVAVAAATAPGVCGAGDADGDAFAAELEAQEAELLAT